MLNVFFINLSLSLKFKWIKFQLKIRIHKQSSKNSICNRMNIKSRQMKEVILSYGHNQLCQVMRQCHQCNNFNLYPILNFKIQTNLKYTMNMDTSNFIHDQIAKVVQTLLRLISKIFKLFMVMHKSMKDLNNRIKS